MLISRRYTQGCYHQRNRYLVDHADALLAVYNGLPEGGTAYTVKYAHSRAKEIVLLDPNNLERTMLPPRLAIVPPHKGREDHFPSATIFSSTATRS